MFGKKKQAATGPAGAKVEMKKEKELSNKETMIAQIKQLSAGQILRYRLRENWGVAVDDESAIVELNPAYTGKGVQYILSMEKLVDGKLTGKKEHFGESKKPRDIANWVLSRKGELFVAAEGPAASK